MEVNMYIKSDAKKNFLRWMESAKVQLGFISCLERFGIKDLTSLKLVNKNVFVCVTEKGERYVLRMQANSEKEEVWVDCNNERCYFSIENGIIQKHDSV